MKVLNPMGGNGNSEVPTPQALYNRLDAEFHFTLDVCASAENAKCARFLSGPCIGGDSCECGLCSSWAGETCWMNPVYTAREIDKWIDKALLEAARGATVVGLLLLSGSPKWARRSVPKAHDMRLIYPRIEFTEGVNSQSRDHMLLVWRGPHIPGTVPLVTMWTWLGD